MFGTMFFLQGTMASVSEGVGERRVTMVGPPYLYRGAQVCGRRTSRTCIFLLISFGAALCMIGLVLFTADLAMESGLWVAGVVFMALGGKKEKVQAVNTVYIRCNLVNGILTQNSIAYFCHQQF